MLTKRAAKTFFIAGTVACFGAFILLTIDTVRRVPKQTNAANLNESAIRGKHLWDRNNCMGCHTLFGEGAYYAPELTKVYERRGPTFITAMIKDPERMYPGRRQMVNYGFKDSEIADLVAFLKWAGEVDLNGFPKKPHLAPAQAPGAIPPSNLSKASGATVAAVAPTTFQQTCMACHALGGQGGSVGPALDTIGQRMTKDQLVLWLRDPAAVRPNTQMPKLPLAEADIEQLSTFLAQQKGG